MIYSIIVFLTIFRICLFIYACVFCAVNFYYLRDDVDIIYNPKKLADSFRIIMKKCL